VYFLKFDAQKFELGILDETEAMHIVKKAIGKKSNQKTALSPRKRGIRRE
jgi:hypothetical protein